MNFEDLKEFLNSHKITEFEKKKKIKIATYLDHFFHWSFFNKNAPITVRINQVYGVVKITKALDKIKNIVQIKIK